MLKNKMSILYRAGLVSCNSDGGDGGGDGANDTRTFTQDEVTALLAAEAAKSKRAAAKSAQEDLEKKLEGASLDDLIAAHKAAKEADDAKKSEAERLLEQAQQTQAEAARALAEAKKTAHKAVVDAALITAGLPKEGLSAITLPNLTVESTEDEIKAEVEKLKATLPGLFNAGGNGGTDGDPGKGGGAPKGTEVEVGVAEAKRRIEERQKRAQQLAGK